MLKSMTGYGKTVAEYGQKIITIEIKSLNSKQLDLFAKIPAVYKEFELEIRQDIGRRIERGKVDLSINIDYKNEGGNYSINKAMFSKYYNDINSILSDINHNDNSNILPVIFRLPEVIRSEKEEIAADEVVFLKSIINTTIDKLDEFRTSEGISIDKDMKLRISLIEQYLKSVEPFETERIANMKNKLNSHLANNISKDKIDANRFEQEIIYYIEKFDITEEKIRLKNHCEYFIETLKENISNGRKLSFICQEIGREINTLGSKANEFNIQKIVVQMKDELEKIKEQISNIL